MYAKELFFFHRLLIKVMAFLSVKIMNVFQECFDYCDSAFTLSKEGVNTA